MIGLISLGVAPFQNRTPASLCAATLAAAMKVLRSSLAIADSIISASRAAGDQVKVTIVGYLLTFADRMAAVSICISRLIASEVSDSRTMPSGSRMLRLS